MFFKLKSLSTLLKFSLYDFDDDDDDDDELAHLQIPTHD